MLEVLGDDKKLETRRAGKRILTEVGVTERLARASSRHPWRTILAWIGAIVVALVLAATLLPGNLTTNGHVTGNPQSKQAESLFQQRFPPDQNAVDELIVVSSAADTVNDPAFTSFLTHLRTKAAATGVVYRYSALGVSRDRHAMLIGVQRQADVDKLLSLVERENGRVGFSVSMTGKNTLDRDFNKLSQQRPPEGRARLRPAGRADHAAARLRRRRRRGSSRCCMAIVSIVVALGLHRPRRAGVQALGLRREHAHGMGLALGIDYCALRRLALPRGAARAAREQDRRDRAPPARRRAGPCSSAAARSCSRCSGCCSCRRTIMRSLAAGAILVGIVSVVAALTLLPAVLGLLGDRSTRCACRSSAATSGEPTPARAASGRAIVDARPAAPGAQPRRSARRCCSPLAVPGSRPEHRRSRRQHAARPPRVEAGLRRARARLPGARAPNPAQIVVDGDVRRAAVAGSDRAGCGASSPPTRASGAARSRATTGRRRWPCSASRSAATRPAGRSARCATCAATCPRGVRRQRRARARRRRRRPRTSTTSTR